MNDDTARQDKKRRGKRWPAAPYRCGPAAVQVHVVDTATDLEAQAYHLTEQGMVLSVRQPVVPGCTLALRLRDREALPEKVLTARALDASAEADGTWRVRCAFVGSVEQRR